MQHSTLTFYHVLANIRNVRSCKADIYHVTGDVHYLVMALPGKKTVLTIHDCVFIETSAGLKRGLLKLFFLDWPVKRAKIITTISEKSKLDIVKYSGCNPAKVVVIPNPLNGCIYYKAKIFNIVEPVILFLGHKPNKNLHRVAEALQNIICKLRIVGKLPDESILILNRFQINFVCVSNITEDDLADEYYHADVILFPSLYEGFGLPITEGNKAGRVVVTSNISPMKEIAGDAACLVDPLNVASIRDGILKVIGNEVYRNQIIEAGFRNADRFDPESIAAQYTSVYKRIIR